MNYHGRKYIIEGNDLHCIKCGAMRFICYSIDDSNRKKYTFCYKCVELLEFRRSISWSERYNHVLNSNNYKAYCSQYTKNNDNKSLKYSSRIYLEKFIEKHYRNNEDIKKNYDKILNLNDKLEEAFQQIKDSKRKNSLNVHFKIYKLLQLCGEKCNLSKVYKISPNTLNEYNKMWKKICEINEWELIN